MENTYLVRSVSYHPEYEATTDEQLEIYLNSMAERGYRVIKLEVERDSVFPDPLKVFIVFERKQ